MMRESTACTESWAKSCECGDGAHHLVNDVSEITLPQTLTQGPKDGNVIIKSASGAILGEGPTQAVSVGHVGFSVTLDAKQSATALMQGVNTGALLRNIKSSCSK